MNAKYIKDLSYDAEITWFMFSFMDKASGQKKANGVGMSNDLYKKLLEAKDYQDIKKDLEGFLNKKYSEVENDFDKTANEYQEEWDKIGDIFSKEIVKITQNDWFHDVFYVVLSPINKGVSSTGGNKVVRSMFEDAKEQARITAHEILMSHIWSILFEKYGETARGDKHTHYWALNEITTTAILGLEESINNLWPISQKGFDGFLSNYRKLKDVKNALKELYLKKSSFPEFLDGGIFWIDNNYKNKTLL